MTQTNPATPAQAATPGSNDQGQQTGAPATQGGTKTPPAGTPTATVTISAEELRNLQRDAGRYQSFQKRSQFTKKPGSPGAAPAFDPNDPAASAISQAQAERDAATQRALRAEVSLGVGEILGKPEFASLPESTKALIRKNPSALSNADNVEEALVDIEDFVREEVAKIPINSGAQSQTPSQGPKGHETPPSPGSGGPSQAPATDLEDLSKLSGPARSRAAIRNAIKVKNRGSAA